MFCPTVVRQCLIVDRSGPYYYHHHYPSRQLAYRAATKLFHPSLSLASLWMVPKLWFVFISASTVFLFFVFLFVCLFFGGLQGCLRSTTLSLSLWGPVDYTVRTFQNPILVFVLALRTSIFLSVASFQLSLLPFIQVSEGSGRPSHTVVVDVFIAVSETRLFFFFFTVPGC